MGRFFECKSLLLPVTHRDFQSNGTSVGLYSCRDGRGPKRREFSHVGSLHVLALVTKTVYLGWPEVAHGDQRGRVRVSQKRYTVRVIDLKTLF